MWKRLPTVLLGILLAGCQSVQLGPYVSPRVVGRVVAADTHQPLESVQVQRGTVEPRPKAGWPPKGGELLMRKEPVRTDHDGRFELESERILALVSWGGWTKVRLTFEHAGYERLQTNYSVANLVTNSPGPEPVIDTGEVILRPSSNAR